VHALTPAYYANNPGGLFGGSPRSRSRAPRTELLPRTSEILTLRFSSRRLAHMDRRPVQCTTTRTSSTPQPDPETAHHEHSSWIVAAASARRPRLEEIATLQLFATCYISAVTGKALPRFAAPGYVTTTLARHAHPRRYVMTRSD
jgi:hypothetical protein